MSTDAGFWDAALDAGTTPMTPGDCVAPAVAALTAAVGVGGAAVCAGALETADACAVRAAVADGDVGALNVHAPAGDTGGGAPPVCGS